MPYSYSIDPVRRLVTITWEGVVCPTSGEEATRRIMTDPIFRPSYAHLIDLTRATYHVDSHTSRRFVLENVAIAAPLIEGDAVGSRGRMAFVTGDELSFGSACQFRAFAATHGIPVEVFRDVDAARAWLAAAESPPRRP
jgi:hypothetical protein